MTPPPRGGSFVNVVDEHVAGMIEREEVEFFALLDRPGALRYLSPEKLRIAVEWLREHAKCSDHPIT
jgi:hypothetical protein